MPSLSHLLAFAGFTIATLTPLSAQEAHSKAEQTFIRIAAQLKSGEGEAALAQMTDTAAEEFLQMAMLTVAEAVAADEEIPKTWLDGTPVSATPENIGFDSFEFPKWYLDQNGIGGSPTQNEHFEKSLLTLLKQNPDRNAAIKDLYLMSEALLPGELGAKIVPPKNGVKPSSNRIWVAINYGDDDIENIPLRFEPDGETLKYAGTDQDFIEQQRKQWRFIEKEDLPLAGLADNDQQVALADYKDKVVLIDFWGTT